MGVLRNEKARGRRAWYFVTVDSFYTGDLIHRREGGSVSYRDREIERSKEAQRMNLERVTALNDLSRELMARHTYFMTAAAGACIGLTLTKLSGNANTVTQWFIIFALLSWAVCFLSGVLHVETQMQHMKYNADQLQLKTKTGRHRNIDEKLQIERNAVLCHQLGLFSERGAALWKAQYWSMLLGASAFIFANVLPSIFNCDAVCASKLENLVEIRVQVK